MTIKNLLLFFFIVIPCILFSQEKKCCDLPDCKTNGETLAEKITILATPLYLKHSSVDQHTLDSLRLADPRLEKEFVTAILGIVAFLNNNKPAPCFADKLPQNKSGDYIFDWISFFNDQAHPVRFPSAEFCRGWKKRFEVSQGAANIFNKRMTYFGSLRAYAGYTFAEKNNCGGRIRLMAGPAGFVRENISFLTLATRAAFRVKDIAPKNFALGNLNLFGEYYSNFNRFNYVSAGAEIELGPYGLNFAVNADTRTWHTGFLIGLVISNKKFKK